MLLAVRTDVAGNLPLCNLLMTILLRRLISNCDCSISARDSCLQIIPAIDAHAILKTQVQVFNQLKVTKREYSWGPDHAYMLDSENM